jgi:hypothetical protein
MISHIVLVVAVMMAGDTPDIKKQVDVPTIEKCQEMARKFLDESVPDIEGAVGLSATCGVFSEGEGP